MRKLYEKPVIELEEYQVLATDYGENVGDGDTNPDGNDATGDYICYADVSPGS